MENGKLSVKGTALAFGILWGGTMFFVSVMYVVVPGYGTDFLRAMDSIYPGYDMNASLVTPLIAGGYGFVDGTIGGAVFAWLYNLFAEKRK